MIVLSVNVKFGGRDVAKRAATIVAELQSVASFGSALLFVQECSPASMRAISELLRDTHVGFARPGHESVVGIFVATFVPRGLRVHVTAAATPFTRMGRDYHAVRMRDGDLYNVHLDSCSDSAATRVRQLAAIAAGSAGPFAILGDLNGHEKYATRGIDVAVRPIQMPKLTDHSARVYSLRLSQKKRPRLTKK